VPFPKQEVEFLNKFFISVHFLLGTFAFGTGFITMAAESPLSGTFTNKSELFSNNFDRPLGYR
jgi:hypothetical protein